MQEGRWGVVKGVCVVRPRESQPFGPGSLIGVLDPDDMTQQRIWVAGRTGGKAATASVVTPPVWNGNEAPRLSGWGSLGLSKLSKLRPEAQILQAKQQPAQAARVLGATGLSFKQLIPMPCQSLSSLTPALAAVPCLRWRVDAEVKLALERAQRDMAAMGGGNSAETARLQVRAPRREKREVLSFQFLLLPQLPESYVHI